MRKRKILGARQDLLMMQERRDGDEFKNIEDGEEQRLQRTLVRIMKKALLNDYKVKMEEALIK